MSTINNDLTYAVADATGISVTREQREEDAAPYLMRGQQRMTHDLQFLDYHFYPALIGWIDTKAKIAFAFVDLPGELSMTVIVEKRDIPAGVNIKTITTLPTTTTIKLLSQAESAGIQASFEEPGSTPTLEKFLLLTDPFVIREYSRDDAARFTLVSEIPRHDHLLDERQS